MVWYPAFAQESVSRASSHILSKLNDVASRGDMVRRLEWAVSNLEVAIERSRKLPITDVSLLWQRKQIKSLCIEGRELLRTHEQLQLGGREEVMSSSSLGRVVTRAANSSVISLLGIDKGSLSSSTVKKFEQYAEWADKFLERVESGCSLRHYMISNNPHLRLLFESKTLGRGTCHQQSFVRIWSTRSEERGVEASLAYGYEDPKMPEKSFFLMFGLRLSESTDIIGTAIKCLQPLVPQFKDAAESAIGQLSQQATATSNLLVLSPSMVDLIVPVKKIVADISHTSRLDPICCWSNEHGPSSDNTVSSELPYICPEEVTFLIFNFYVLLEKRNNLRRSSDAAGRSVMLPLEVNVTFMPHYDVGGILRELVGLQGSASIEFGSNQEFRLISIQEVLDTVGSTAMQSYLQRPELTNYGIRWFSEHGAALFDVTKPTTRRSAKRKR